MSVSAWNTFWLLKLTSAGTATNHMVQLFAPIVIAPGGNLNIAHISPSQSGARSYQVSFGFWVR